MSKVKPQDKHFQGHRREVEAGNIHIPVNSRSLSEMIHPNTLPMERDYKFIPGKGNRPPKMETSTHRCHADCVLHAAQNSQMRLSHQART
jgi:hypothetical protein